MHYIAPQIISSTTNSNTAMEVQISVAANALIGLSVSFTLATQSTTNVDASGYITFDMVTAPQEVIWLLFKLYTIKIMQNFIGHFSLS